MKRTKHVKTCIKVTFENYANFQKQPSNRTNYKRFNQKKSIQERKTPKFSGF